NALTLSLLLGQFVFDGPPEGDEPPPLDYDTEDRLRAVLGDIGVPRRETERIFQIYRAQRRLVGGKSRRFSPRSFVLKNYFNEAWQFFGVLVQVSGGYQEAFEQWRSMADSAPPEAAGTSERRR